MKNLLFALSLGLVLSSCLGGNGLDTSGNPAIDEEDVKAITPGTAVGVVYSGTWVLDTVVEKTNCGTINIGDTLPKEGEKDEETVVLAQDNGELTRVFDDAGTVYTFRGSVDKDGSFTYGLYYDLSGSLKYIEVVTGSMALDQNTGKATMSASSNRRYVGGIVDCSADVSMTGERTLVGK